MQLIRVSSATLALVSSMVLAACSDSGTTTTAASAPASPASAASTTAQDRKLCTSVQKIGQDVKDHLVDISQSGKKPTPATFTGILNNLAEKVTAEAFAAGDSDAALAARQLGAEASKAAKDKDPVAAAGSAGFEKAGTDLTAACKTVGVDVVF